MRRPQKTSTVKRVVADATNLTTLKRTEQPRLQRLGKLADLFENQRLPISHLDEPRPLLVGTTQGTKGYTGDPVCQAKRICQTLLSRAIRTAALDPRVLRRHILHMAHHGRSAHLGCAMSIVEICAALFGGIMQYDRSDPLAPHRDLLVLSKGHGVMALYACFRELGWVGDDDLRNYLGNGTRLRGVCEVDIPGCEVSSGSLGHGLPVAVGMAFGLLRQQSQRRVWCIVGDGEMNEGTMWEAMLFAAHRRLGNLTVIVDANGFQAMGHTAEVLRLEPLVSKFAAFGFAAVECDGHDVHAIAAAVRHEESKPAMPRAVIARTVKGNGVSFMAANNRWHYTRLTDDTLAAALDELR